MAKNQTSKLRFEDVYMRVEKGNIDPIYFLNGSEEYLKIEFLKLLRRKLFGDQEATTNIERISASAGSAPEIIDLASDYSLFSGGRLVVVYDVQKISTKGQEALLGFFPTIPPSNTLVLFGPPTFDLRKKFYKYLTKDVIWSTLTGLSERSAPFWIRKRLEKHGMHITQEAVQGLLRYIGNSYGLLANQIDKLAIALEGQDKVDIADIETHTSVSAEYDVFKLLDAVDRHDRSKAFEILGKLLEKSDGFGSVLYWLGERAFQYYLIASNRHNMTNSELASLTKQSPYRIPGMIDAISGKEPKHYEELIKSVSRAEVSMRFDHIPPKLILEELIISLT